MNMNGNKIEEKGLKEVFSEVLGPSLDFEILNRALSAFLSDNYGFSDFNLRFNPPLLLSEELFKSLVIQLSGYFDSFGFTDVAERIFMVLTRITPENKKRIVIIYYHENINGKIMYRIENINGKTYTNP